MADDESPRVVGEFVEYSDFVQAVRDRVADLSIHGTRFDNLAGLSEGYLSKLICARPVRRIGMASTPWALSSRWWRTLPALLDSGGYRRGRRQPMSAIPPKATLLRWVVMSALCQYATMCRAQNEPVKIHSGCLFIAPGERHKL
jgi:hypothetical protein